MHYGLAPATQLLKLFHFYAHTQHTTARCVARLFSMGDIACILDSLTHTHTLAPAHTLSLKMHTHTTHTHNCPLLCCWCRNCFLMGLICLAWVALFAFWASSLIFSANTHLPHRCLYTLTQTHIHTTHTPARCVSRLFSVGDIVYILDSLTRTHTLAPAKYSVT